MDDRQEFPENIMDFIDTYSFKDSKNIYTNRSLIPVFRVEQAIEHYMNPNENKIVNARITDTMLGREDHGIFTFEIFVEFGGSYLHHLVDM